LLALKAMTAPKVDPHTGIPCKQQKTETPRGLSKITTKGGAEQTLKLPRLKDSLTEELVIAVVGPVGSGCSTTSEMIREVLRDEYSYAVSSFQRFNRSQRIGVEMYGSR
jgi:pantothenate kinase-related protein Tda10